VIVPVIVPVLTGAFALALLVGLFVAGAVHWYVYGERRRDILLMSTAVFVFALAVVIATVVFHLRWPW
jgi:uncharacterized protein HemY